MHKIIIGLLALFSCSFIQAAPDASQPNILLVLTDDQGWGDLGCHENPHLKTPNILTPHQVKQYNMLRGYGAADPCANPPKGHDAKMWRKHNGCD